MELRQNCFDKISEVECLVMEMTTAGFLGAETAPAALDLLKCLVLTSKRELAANLKRVEDRPLGPAADSVLNDRISLEISSEEKGSISEETEIV